MLRLLTAVACYAAASAEVIVKLPSNGSIGLSTRGPSSFRVRFLLDAAHAPIDTVMVAPVSADAPFQQTSTSNGTGITAAFGAVIVEVDGRLSLLDKHGALLTKTQPLGGGGKQDICAAAVGMDVGSATRVAPPRTVTDQNACCDACKAASGCTNWIYGHPGNAEGNCWLVADPSGMHANSARTLGGPGVGPSVAFSTSGVLYGGGSGPGDARLLTKQSVSPHVENKETYVPHYYSTDGYAALGVVDKTTGGGKTNYFPAAWGSDGQSVAWSFGKGAFELYLMPAATLDEGTSAYYQLVGMPKVPPRYAFGFFASRWGWQNRSYIEQTLTTFRSGNYPIDSFITDFGWFTNVSDYGFSSAGETYYNDFGFSADTFPDPAAQLASYHRDLHFHMGGDEFRLFLSTTVSSCPQSLTTRSVRFGCPGRYPQAKAGEHGADPIRCTAGLDLARRRACGRAARIRGGAQPELLHSSGARMVRAAAGALHLNRSRLLLERRR